MSVNPYLGDKISAILWAWIVSIPYGQGVYVILGKGKGDEIEIWQ